MNQNRHAFWKKLRIILYRIDTSAPPYQTYSQRVLLTWLTVGQGPIVLSVGADGRCLDIFSLIYHFSFLSPSLWEMARYRLKYCLKGPLSPKQPTNQPTKHTLCNLPWPTLPDHRVYPVFLLFSNRKPNGKSRVRRRIFTLCEGSSRYLLFFLFAKTNYCSWWFPWIYSIYMSTYPIAVSVPAFILFSNRNLTGIAE